MFKNRALQVKMVKTPLDEESADTIHISRFTAEELQWAKEIVKTVGYYYITKVALDTALKIYLKN